MKVINQLHFRNLKGDIFGGITAAIVALPLALAFGVSSGVGAIHGLYGAIFVGFFAALCGGTPSQISGPTGPMTVVITSVFTSLIAESPEQKLATVFTIVMIGGLFQILFGILKLGKYITLMPYTVISGFMSGVGVIIIILQIAPLWGHDGSGNIIESLKNLAVILPNPHLSTLMIGGLTLLIVFLWPPHLNRIVPSPLVALIGCTILAFYLPNAENIARIGDIPVGLPQLYFPTFQREQLQQMVGAGLMLASLGAVDSLLTSLVADNITRTQHDSDRELVGQGIGNLIAGICGGMPGAGATMRTVINVRAGGKTPLSGIVHAGLLLILVLGAGPLTEQIPHAVLAGILIKVGIDIIDWGFLKRSYLASMKATGIMYTVLLMTVFVDLIKAVVVGVFIANIFTIKRLTDLQSDRIMAIRQPTDGVDLSEEEQSLLKKAEGQVLLFRLGGPMSFGAAKTMSQRITMVDDYKVLILDMNDVPMIGITASLAIETMLKDATEKGREVFLVGAKGPAHARLRRLKILDIIPPKHRIHKRVDALYDALTLIQ